MLCCGVLVATLAADPVEPPGPSSRATGLVISEIMYHPADRDDGRKQGFIELYNSSPFPEDISGYRLSGDISATFPMDRTIGPGEYVVIPDKTSDFRAIYPDVANILTNFSGSLSGSGGTIRLRNRSDAILLEVTYQTDQPWPLLPDGKGYSLVLTRSSYGQGDPRAWAASSAPDGSPGRTDPPPSSPLANVAINEFLANASLPDLDFVELYNRSGENVDLSGCTLSDSPSTNKFTFQGAVIGARSYLALDEFSLGFSFKAEGDDIYFRNPAGGIVDVVRFGPQARGISQGRVPEGGREFYPLFPPTPFAPNTAPHTGNVVINEIMYAPIPGDSSDQYVELYNRGTNAIDVSGWQFTDGITFTIPPGTSIPANGYLVVAQDAARLQANHPHLSTTNTVGNFTGSLASEGERIALSRLEPLVQNKVTNFIYVAADEVTYKTGGRWGDAGALGQPRPTFGWSHWGGSSLELIDARSENRLAANWADSDESKKASWTTIEFTGELENGVFSPSNSALFIFLLGAGECLLDDVEVRLQGNANNLVSNGSFDSNADGWVREGNHERSFWTPENSGTFRLRSSGSGNPLGNCVKTALPLPLNSGTVTLRANAKWLRGHPNIVTRLSGNYLEAAATLSIPNNLGTPGQPNSTAVSNAGPAVFNVRHDPAAPAAGQPVVVTAQFHDPDGLAQPILRYRIDPAPVLTSVPMNDNGTVGDVAAADGIFSATIPGQGEGTIVAFYIEAADQSPSPAISRFPTDAPNRECNVRFGEVTSETSIGTYRIWMNSRNFNRWTSRSVMSDEPLDCTLVYGTNRIIYNARIRYGGDTFMRTNFASPFDSSSAYVVSLPADDRLHGSDELLLEPVLPSRDATALRERTAIWMAEQLGLPFNNQRFVQVALNGVPNTNRGIPVFIDRQLPDSRYLQSWFSGDDGGELFEATPWLEPGNPNVIAPARLVKYPSSELVKGRYRGNWPKREGAKPERSGDDDYTHFFQLVDTLSATGATYSANLQFEIDTEEWINALAFRHVLGDWDAYGYRGGGNDFIYKGVAEKWQILPGRILYALGSSGGDAPTANAFDVENGETSIARMYNDSALRRLYLRLLQRAVNGPLALTNVQEKFIDPAYQGLQSNGIVVASAAADRLLDWIAQRRSYLADLLPSVSFSLDQANTVIDTTNNLVTLSGTAPLEVDAITINGVAYPITWTTPTNWVIAFATKQPQTVVSIGAWKSGGLVGQFQNATINYSGVLEWPEDLVVINEIMYNPTVNDAAYVEIFNRSLLSTFDLSNWRVAGVDYFFPPGTLITNGQFLVIARNYEAFRKAYGPNIPIFGLFPGTLDLPGDTLGLQPPLSPRPYSAVRYEAGAPWPAAANGGAASLQLIDAARDVSRVSNWSADSPTPGAPNRNTASIADFPRIWISEVQPNNVDGISDFAGEREPWVEIFADHTLSLDGYALSSTYSNLAQWVFPSGTVIGPSNYMVIFADGQPEQSSSTAPHTNFRLPPTNGSIVLSKDGRILDYINYRDMDGSFSYGSFPENQLVDRQHLFYPTPGMPNDSRPRVLINEWLASNDGGLLDPATGTRKEDWIELYNAGPQAINLSGFHLTDTLTQPSKWTFPTGTVITAHGFLLVWADNATSATTPSNLHASFKLDKGGEAIGLYTPNGAWIDRLTFGPQQNNISQGRFPDGSLTEVLRFMYPTPLAANVLPTNQYPPVLPALDNRTVDEGSLLAVTIFAVDDDFPAQTLTYSLDPSAPSGTLINSTNGRFTWMPTEAQGGLSYPITIHVTDNGSPARTDVQTFAVTVNEVNSSPLLTNLNNSLRTIDGLSTITLTNRATDSDIPPNNLTYQLLSAPLGATLDSITGVFAWTPSSTQSSSTNLIVVRVSDNGVPSLTATQSFTVIVRASLTITSIRQTTTEDLSVSWECQPGKRYQLEFKDDLGAPGWQPLPNSQITAEASHESLTIHKTSAPQRFYRVVALD